MVFVDSMSANASPYLQVFGVPAPNWPASAGSAFVRPAPAQHGVAHSGRYFDRFSTSSDARSAAPEPTHRHAPPTGGQLAQAAGLIALGLLLNRIPPRPSAFELVSTRVEDWAKMALGVLATDKINTALAWKPPAWLQALETVGVLTFISQGLHKKGWKHFPLLAIGVPALVQATLWATETAEAALDRADSDLPRWIPKVGIGVASTLAGVFGLRGIMQAPWYRSAVGRMSGDAASQQVIGAEAVVCSRCGGMHLVCMEEISDFIGAMAGWAHEQFSPPKPWHASGRGH